MTLRTRTPRVNNDVSCDWLINVLGNIDNVLPINGYNRMNNWNYPWSITISHTILRWTDDWPTTVHHKSTPFLGYYMYKNKIGYI